MYVKNTRSSVGMEGGKREPPGCVQRSKVVHINMIDDFEIYIYVLQLGCAVHTHTRRGDQYTENQFFGMHGTLTLPRVLGTSIL